MILPKFVYAKAQSTEDAVRLYHKFGGKGLYFAGGTDIIPRLKLRLHTPHALIDLKHIEEMNGVAVGSGQVSIGANTTLFELRNHRAVREHFPALSESLAATASETLQMRGTIGGNILQDTRCLFYNQSLQWRSAKGFCFKMGGKQCNAVPGGKTCFAGYCADNAPALLSLSARVALYGIDGERTIDMADLFTGKGGKPFTVRPGEILTKILIPLRKTKGAYNKIRVRDSIDYPLAAAAISVCAGQGAIAIGAVGPSPVAYPFMEITDSAIRQAIERAYGDAKPVANRSLPAAYRKRMVRVLARKVAARVLGEEKR